MNIEDVNKKIYFLNNKSLKGLNQSNSTIYIDNEEYIFNNYFIPEKKGLYNITLEIMNINLSDCSYMFSECKNIIQILFTYFNFEIIENMSHMFYGCENLIAIDLSSFKTKHVMDMSNMFEG